jgi:hypothetical protein
MTTKLVPTLGVLALAITVAGCAQPGGEKHNESQAGGQPAAHGEAPAAEAAATKTDAPAMVEGTQVTLAGTTGCAHCSFQTARDCASAVKIASGDVIVLDGVAQDSELWKDRETPRNIQLTGTVVPSQDGLKHVKLESYQLN